MSDTTARSQNTGGPAHWGRLTAGVLAAWLLLGNTLPFLHHTDTADALPPHFSAAACLGPSQAQEQVACIEDNEDALCWRLRLIHNAQRELCFSCFELRDDESGQAVIAALLDAADRGVQVRVLLDGFNAHKLAGSRWLAALDAQPGVQIRLYAPWDLARPWTLQTLLHDKYLIADDTAYLLGGRNSYDRFLQNSPGASEDRELLVWQRQLATDSSLYQLRDYFEQVWALDACTPYRTRAGGDRRAVADALRRQDAAALAADPSLASAPDWAALTLPARRVTLLHNPIQPRNKAPVLWAQLCALMAQSEDVLFQTPYAICSEEMYRDLAALTGGGCRLTVLTNAVETGANLVGCVDYLGQKPRLLAAGLTLYEYAGPRSSHTKTVLIGDRLSVVGSYNLDMRSSYLDTELMLAVDCPALNAALRQTAKGQLAASLRVAPDGSSTPGAAYAPPPLPAAKKLLYTLLRPLLHPFRFLF